LSPATAPCDMPPRRPRKPCGMPARASERMTSTVSAKAASDLLGRIAAQFRGTGNTLQLGAHQGRADRLYPPPAPERCDEARRRLRIDRIERQDQSGDQPIAFAAFGMEALRRAGEGHIERADP